MGKDKKLVVKHNKLVEFKGRMTTNELKLFSLIISDVREHQDKQFEEYQIDVTVLKDMTKDKNFYNYICDVAFKLENKRILVERINQRGKRERTSIRLINKPYIVEDSKNLGLYIDKDLIPYIIDLKREFTRYQIENILRLRSSYAVRVYELMKQYENIEKREISVEDLREYLGIEPEEYKRFYDFEKWVLKVSKEEINEYTDLNIDYVKNKKGRNITSITFKIHSKSSQDKEYINYLNENYNIADIKQLSGIDKENFNTKQVMDLYEIAIEKIINEDISPFEYIKLNYIHILENKAVRNKYSYLKKALKEDYAIAIGQLRLKITV